MVASPEPSMLQSPLDPVSIYLNSPLANKAKIDKMGGLMNYWMCEMNSGSTLAQMALDVLSSPGMHMLI